MKIIKEFKKVMRKRKEEKNFKHCKKDYLAILAKCGDKFEKHIGISKVGEMVNKFKIGDFTIETREPTFLYEKDVKKGKKRQLSHF